MKNYIPIISLLFFLGCATTGTKIDSNKIAEIEKGITTKAQIVELFGSPDMINLTSDGKTIMTYHFLKYKTKAKTFVPVVGLMSGGSDMNQEVLQILLDESDIVEKYIYNESTSEIKTGLIN